MKPRAFLSAMASFLFDPPQQPHELRMRVQAPQLDATSAPEFKRALEAAWKPGTTRVVLDLGEVEFMDSSGVGALLSVRKLLPPDAEPVTLRRARPAITGVLELLRLQRVFKIE